MRLHPEVWQRLHNIIFRKHDNVTWVIAGLYDATHQSKRSIKSKNTSADHRTIADFRVYCQSYIKLSTMRATLHCHRCKIWLQKEPNVITKVWETQQCPQQRYSTKREMQRLWTRTSSKGTQALPSTRKHAKAVVKWITLLPRASNALDKVHQYWANFSRLVRTLMPLTNHAN